MFSGLKDASVITCCSLLLLAGSTAEVRAQGAERVNRPQRDRIDSVTPPTKPKEGTDVKPSYPTGDLMRPGIRDLRLSPTSNGATLTFNARPGPEPLVEIDKNAPSTDSHKHVSFNSAAVRFNPVMMKNKSTPTDTAYAGGSYQTNIKLEQGALYYYIITLAARGSYPEYQLTGSFTTLGRTLRVTFTRIKILDDSDNESNGDLFFYFDVNPSEPSQIRIPLGDENATLDWESGHVERLQGKRAFTQVIKNAPDRLRLLVTGYDKDSDAEIFGCLLAAPGEEDPLWFEHLRPKRVYPGTTCEKEVNYAKGEFDLSKYPGKYVNIPFTITSMPIGSHGVTLTFDVSGYIEFTNPDIP